MSTPASIAKHPIHPMIVVFPMGLWIFSLIADVIAFAGWSTLWHELATYMIGGGVVGAVLAAVPGLVDFFYLTDPQSRRIGLYHLGVNLTAMLIFVVDLYLRIATEIGPALPLGLSIAGIGLVVCGGWLGGELVYVHGVGVDKVRPGPIADKIRDIQRRNLRRIV